MKQKKGTALSIRTCASTGRVLLQRTWQQTLECGNSAVDFFPSVLKTGVPWDLSIRLTKSMRWHGMHSPDSFLFFRVWIYPSHTHRDPQEHYLTKLLMLSLSLLCIPDRPWMKDLLGLTPLGAGITGLHLFNHCFSLAVNVSSWIKFQFQSLSCHILIGCVCSCCCKRLSLSF